MDISEKNETKVNFQGIKYCQQIKYYVCFYNNNDVSKWPKSYI